MATKKPTSKASRAKTHKKTRKIEQHSYKSFRLHKKIRPQTKPLPKARKLLGASLNILTTNKRLFFGIIAVQVFFTLIFVTGSSVFFSQLQETKDLVEQLTGDQSALVTGAALIGILATSSASGDSDIASLYGLILLIINGLAIIWALRQAHTANKPRFKEAYYKGMYPLIPFLMVMTVVLLQLIPLVIGSTLYKIVVSNGIAVTALEQVIWVLLYMGLSLLSLYMITSSLFALYIVTLPDVTPMQALRSARQLVLHRRMAVIGRLLVLSIVIFIFLIIVMLPIVIYVTSIAEAMFFLLGNITILVVHAYLYELYRELL